MALVSIIIPTYNRAHLIDETLDSVLAQTYQNWECIIVDDGSNDDTETVIKKKIGKDKRFKFLKRPITLNKGANSCRNFGYSKAKGKFINWLDSDDILDPNHLAIHVENHSNSKIHASVSTAGIFYNKVGDSEDLWFRQKHSNNFLDDMIAGKIAWQTGSVVWKKTVLKTNPFNESLHSGQEWYLHTSNLINNVKFELIESKTIFVRRHEDRIGTSTSEAKLFSRFKSRYEIYNLLKTNHKLSNQLDYNLNKTLIQALKKLLELKYLKKSFRVLILLPRTMKDNYKLNYLKILFFGVLMKLVFNRGESFFKI